MKIQLDAFVDLEKCCRINNCSQKSVSVQPKTGKKLPNVLTTVTFGKPEAMYTESAFRREELEGSGGEKQPEEGMESAEILRNICEKDVTLFRTAHSKDLNSVSWALRTLVEREPETFFRYL